MSSPQVIYIAGSGRSGSTLFELLLAETVSATATGELRHVWSSGFLGAHLCGCGVPLNECPQWGPMLLKLASEVDPLSMAGALRHIERNRFLLEHLVAAWRSRRLAWRPHSPVLGQRQRPWRAPQQDLGRYLAGLSALYRIVLSSDDVVMTNSSKSPVHAMLLARAIDAPLHVVHLVRDSRAVAFSWTRQRENPGSVHGKRMPQYDSARSARDWLSYQFGSLWLRYVATSYQVVRYEDFVDRPRTVVLATLARQGFAESRLRPVWGSEHEVTLSRHHTTHGNPMRFKTGTIKIAADEEWRRAMPRRAFVSTTARTLPLLLAYRYPVRRHAPDR